MIHHRIILSLGPHVVARGAIIIDCRNRRIYIDGVPVLPGYARGYLHFNVLRHLLLKGEALSTWRELIDAAWGDDEDGGPLDTAATFKVMAHKYWAPILAKAGLRLRSVHGQGYRLEPITGNSLGTRSVAA